MKHNWMIWISLVIGAPSFAADSNAHKEGPCKQIKEACEAAGFIKGEAKDGKGLWVDCVRPIMQGTPNPKSKLPLPQVSPEVVKQCKQKHPKFGAERKSS